MIKPIPNIQKVHYSVCSGTEIASMFNVKDAITIPSLNILFFARESQKRTRHNSTPSRLERIHCPALLSIRASVQKNDIFKPESFKRQNT